MQNSTNLKSVASNYGLYLALAVVLIFSLAYALSVEMFTKWYLSLILFFVLVGFGVASTKACKSAATEIFSFKKAFTAYFICVIIGLVAQSLTQFSIFNLIDPEAGAYIVEFSKEQVADTMAKFGSTQEQIDLTIAGMEQENQFSLKNQAIGLATNIVFYSIIGLIVALVFRQKQPDNL